MPYIHTMLKNRFIPALGLALLIPLGAPAQTPPAGAVPTPSSTPGAAPTPGAPVNANAPVAEPPTEEDKAVDEAARKIAALSSIAADLTESVVMLEQEFTVKGRYLRGPSRRIYLRLDVSGLPDATGTMLQVCDGEVLWDYSKILDLQSYRKVDVGPIFERLKSPDLEEDLRSQIVSQLGFAGPDQLLIGLRKYVKFNQKTAGTLDGKDVWVITGQWKSREGLAGPSQQLPAIGTLPAFIPSLVKLYLGKADGWPYKLELVGSKPTLLADQRKLGPDGKPIGSKASSLQDIKPTRIVLAYTNVQLNPSLKVEEFVFQPPPGVKWTDATTSLVSALDQAIQLRVDQKKANAARSEIPSLPQPIDVPHSSEVPAAGPIGPPTNPSR